MAAKARRRKHKKALNHILTIALSSAKGERKPIVDHVPTMVLTIDFHSVVSKSARARTPPSLARAELLSTACNWSSAAAGGGLVSQMLSDPAIIRPAAPRFCGTNEKTADQHGHSPGGEDE
jgi:hypothetical protein